MNQIIQQPKPPLYFLTPDIAFDNFNLFDDFQVYFSWELERLMGDAPLLINTSSIEELKTALEHSMPTVLSSHTWWTLKQPWSQPPKIVLLNEADIDTEGFAEAVPLINISKKQEQFTQNLINIFKQQWNKSEL